MELSKMLESEGLTCAIPYAKVQEMLRMITETALDNKERAISFCGGDNELSFPSTIGEIKGVAPPECPAGKEKIGDFHTHRLPEEESREKSMEDWFYDVSEDVSVSCLGLPDVDVVRGHAFLQRTISCHTFQRNHPGYKGFQDRLFSATFDAQAYEDEIARITENRDLTPAERTKYKDYKGKVDILIEEGIDKGLIKPCAPLTAKEKFFLPDVEATLAEQRK